MTSLLKSGFGIHHDPAGRGYPVAADDLRRGAGPRGLCKVEVCGTAAEGRHAFDRLRPSVVLLDLMLPDGTGLDVMRDMLRQASRRPA
jgi:CheY-like chemotaxis protein